MRPIPLAFRGAGFTDLSVDIVEVRAANELEACEVAVVAAVSTGAIFARPRERKPRELEPGRWAVELDVMRPRAARGDDASCRDVYCRDCQASHPLDDCVDDVAELIRLLTDAQIAHHEARHIPHDLTLQDKEDRCDRLEEKLRYQLKARYT